MHDKHRARRVCNGLKAFAHAPSDDSGTSTVQLVMIMPFLMALLMFVVFCGRMVETRLRLDAAASAAARSASLARSPSAATAAARATAQAMLGGGGASCPSFTVSADTSGFKPGGTVTVSIICHASAAGLTGIFVPGRVSVRSKAVSSIDPYRSAS